MGQNRQMTAGDAAYLACLLLLGVMAMSHAHASPLDIEGRAFNPGHAVMFHSLDYAGEEGFSTIGIKTSPTEHLGLSGPRILSTFGTKLNEYDAVTGQSHHRLEAIRSMLGYEWVLPGRTITLLAGASAIRHSPEMVLRTGTLGRQGALGMLELWQNMPQDAPFLLTAISVTVMADLAEQGLYARLRPYFRLPDVLAGRSGLRYGPEVSFAVANAITIRDVKVQTGWTKLRIGGHISEIPLLKARMSVSTGLEIPEDGKKRFYGNITTYVRF
jgi:hypothetical protein